MALMLNVFAMVYDSICKGIRVYSTHVLTPWTTPINAYIRLLYFLTTCLILSGYGLKEGFLSDAHWRDVEEILLNFLFYAFSLLGTLIRHPEVIFMPYAYLCSRAKEAARKV
ncbi:hypothetical protein EON63_22540 [archaeon]|nr:MAG: hypothetical protein EON63_22540 [archaeon]